MRLVDKLSGCENYSCIFGVVKEAVEKTIHRRRGGLLLGLTELPNYIGAFYQVGSNFIVMNKKLLADVVNTGDRQLINAYVFHLLLHEYLHTLGFMDEKQVHSLTRAISEEALGSEHVATKIAKHGISSIFPEVGRFENHRQPTWEMDLIEDFETDDLDYLG